MKNCMHYQKQNNLGNDIVNLVSPIKVDKYSGLNVLNHDKQ